MWADTLPEGRIHIYRKEREEGTASQKNAFFYCRACSCPAPTLEIKPFSGLGIDRTDDRISEMGV
jgi:hypothetical protein